MTNGPLIPDLLRKIDADWRAANYLSAGQIYLLDHPLLRKSLDLNHVKSRFLGHGGEVPTLETLAAAELIRE